MRIINKLALAIAIVGTAIFSQCSSTSSDIPKWSIAVNRPDGSAIQLIELPEHITDSMFIENEVDGIKVRLSLVPHANYVAFEASVCSDIPQEVYLSLQVSYDTARFTPFNFNGAVDSAEIYRQSPHDVNAWIVETIAMQAMPVIALKTPESYTVAVSDAPFKYDNFSTQSFYPNEGKLSLNSGDNGQTPGLQPDTSQMLNLDYNAEKTQIFTPGRVLPYYHLVSTNQTHQFRGILFESNGQDINGLREAVMTRSADFFSKGQYTDYFGSLAFTSSYFNLRKNDSSKSKIWVIPAVEYGNTQYGRDAFWISMMLSPEYSAECIKSELAEVNHFAEYPLFAIIWAFRAASEGMEIDLSKVQAYVDAVELRVKDDAYYSYYEGDGRLDFQYWGDLMAFEKNDLLMYNQGLFVVAMKMAVKMGLEVDTNIEHASAICNDMFDEELGFYPLSKNKKVLTPDAILPEVISVIYLKELLLPTERIRSHFDRVVSKSKTPFGFKVVATPNGEYLPSGDYDIPGYKSQVSRGTWVDGEYYRGGSYFLYDNLFLIAAYLHGIEEAHDLLKWRVGLDFQIGSTTYEHINTMTGTPNKPNMGWNVAIYAIWRKLVDEGKADTSLFEEVNKIASGKNIVE